MFSNPGHFVPGDDISASFLNDLVAKLNAARNVSSSEPIRTFVSDAGLQIYSDPIYPLERSYAITTTETALILGDCPANRTTVVRLANTTGGGVNIAGIERSHQGRGAIFWNAGPDDVVMLHDSSSAADDENKILIQGETDTTLGMGDCALAWYLEADQRWRMTGMGATAGGGGGGITFTDFYSSSVLSVDHKAQYYTEQLGATVTLTLASSTITMTPNGTIAPAYLDGGTASIGTRILYNEGREAAGNSLNGILVFTSVGSSSTAVTLVRATDYDSATEITPGSKVTVTDGDEFHDKTFILKNDGTVTVNTTDLIFDLHAEKQDIGYSDLTLVSGDEAVVVLPHICRQIRVTTATAKFQIQGVEPVLERRRRVLWNTGSNTILVMHQHASAAATWRIICATGQNLILYPNGYLFLDYDPTTERWRAAVISDRIAATKNVTADQAPLDLELNRLLRLVPDANMRLIQGIRQLPTSADGLPTRIRDEATLTNDGTFTLALTHADVAVSAHERIICPGATSFELRPSEAVAVVRDNSGSGWNVLSMTRTAASGSSTRTTRNVEGIVSTLAMQQMGDGVKNFDTIGLGGTDASSWSDSGRSTAYPSNGVACTGIIMRQGVSGDFLDVAHGDIFFDGTITTSPSNGYIGRKAPATTGVLGSDGDRLCVYTNPGTFVFTDSKLQIRQYTNTGAAELEILGGSSSLPWTINLVGHATDGSARMLLDSTNGGSVDAKALSAGGYFYVGNNSGRETEVLIDGTYSTLMHRWTDGTLNATLKVFEDTFALVELHTGGSSASPPSRLCSPRFKPRAVYSGGEEAVTYYHNHIWFGYTTFDPSTVSSLEYLLPGSALYVDGSRNLYYAKGTSASDRFRLNVTLNGVSGGVYTFTAQAPLAVNVTGTTIDLSLSGTVDVPHGGTGLTSVTAGVLMLGNGTGNFTELPGSAAGQAAIWNGSAWAAGTAPYTDGTYTFGGGSTGDVASFTITNGIIIGMTFVP